jgi:hypothetical protein
MVTELTATYPVNKTSRETYKMIRYSLFLAAVFAMGIVGLTKLAPAETAMANPHNVTVVYRTAFANSSHPLILEACSSEDCSDTAQ